MKIPKENDLIHWNFVSSTKCDSKLSFNIQCGISKNNCTFQQLHFFGQFECKDLIYWTIAFPTSLPWWINFLINELISVKNVLYSMCVREFFFFVGVAFRCNVLIEKKLDQFGINKI